MNNNSENFVDFFFFYREIARDKCIFTYLCTIPTYTQTHTHTPHTRTHAHTHYMMMPGF